MNTAKVVPTLTGPACDDLIQGALGTPWLMTQSGSIEPRFAPATFADRRTGLNMIHGVMAAIIARDRKAWGSMRRCPCLNACCKFVVGEHLCCETLQPPIAPTGYARLLAVNRKPYATQDVYICALMYKVAYLQMSGTPKGV